MVKDLVCGMKLDELEAAATSYYRGTFYFFCAPGCKTTFDKDPERYVEDPPIQEEDVLLRKREE